MARHSARWFSQQGRYLAARRVDCPTVPLPAVRPARHRAPDPAPASTTPRRRRALVAVLAAVIALAPLAPAELTIDRDTAEL